MSAPNAVDESFSYLDPGYAAAHGIQLVCDYLSTNPSKNWTADQILAYHAQGVGCLFLWETTPNRALSGHPGGLADGQVASVMLRSLIAQVGYAPSTTLSIIAACDFDTNSTQWPTIKSYYQGFTTGLAEFKSGDYGEADVIDQLASTVSVGFQTYAWSGGRLSPHADLYQYKNGQSLAGATVDFDRIINASRLGAWWPPGYSLDSASETELTGDDMPLNDADKAWITTAINQGVMAIVNGNGFKVAGVAIDQSWDATQEAHDRKVIATGDSTVSKVVTDPTTGTHVRVAALQAAQVAMQQDVTAIKAALTTPSADPSAGQVLNAIQAVPEAVRVLLASKLGGTA